MSRYSLTHLSNPLLLRDLAALVAQDRATTAALLAHLAEVDARRLYLPAAYPSMYAWCVGELRLSEDCAFRRIRAARTAREFPAVFPMLADGRLGLNAILRLTPHLTHDNAAELLAAAAGKTDRQVERLLAERFPQPDVLATVQPLAPGVQHHQLAAPPVQDDVNPLALAQVGDPSVRLAPGPVESPAPRARLTPLAPGRFALQVTLDQRAHDQLRYAQALLGHAVPSGDLAQVLGRALDRLVETLEQRRFAAGDRSRVCRRHSSAEGRHIPAAVRRLVWERDGGRCTFVSDSGHRCEATARLEFDHIAPFARGGPATPAGLRLRCRAHNQYEAERSYGADFMRHQRETARQRRARAQGAASAARPAPERQTAQVLGEPRARLAAEAAGRGSAAPPNAADEVIPWLRALGFRQDEARRAAARCAGLPGAPLEVRVRFALASLAPRSMRMNRG